MQKKSIYELEREYNLDIGKIIARIKKEKAKLVLLQFPDGMKPYAVTIADEIEKRCRDRKINAEFLIWLGRCYGACDVPNVSELKPKIDLIVQFGHSKWKFGKK